jgi:hypothetical protein
MSQKTFLSFSLFVFLFGFNVARAGLVINEIMYNPLGDDTKREWVELFNNGTENVTIISGSSSSAWRFDDGGTSLHLINDQIVIPAGGYAILASDKVTFLSENVGFSGLIADTTMSLNNTGVVKLWNGDNPRLTVASQNYDFSSGATNDGNSLQLINNLWTGATPTPGAANSNPTPPAENNTPETNNNQTNNPGSNTGVVHPDNPSSAKTGDLELQTKIIVKTLSFAGLPLPFEGKAFGYAGERLRIGKYFWNFGDGDSKEMMSDASFTHTYFYPGDYTVTLEYYFNQYSQNPDVVNKIKIKVVPAAVLISKVGDQKDFFVELTNNSSYDVDISNWQLTSATSASSPEKIFTLPKNTNILAQQKIILSPQITHFGIEDKNNLQLLSSVGQIIFVYPNSSSRSDLKNSKRSDLLPPGEITPIPAEDLQASAVASNVIPEKANNFYIFYIILIAFLGISGGAVYFIRRNSVISQAQNDFEILDE